MLQSVGVLRDSLARSLRPIPTLICRRIQFPIKRRNSDAQRLGGPLLVSAALVDRSKNHPPLEGLSCCPKTPAGGDRGHGQELGEALGADLGALVENHGALQDVGQLPNVPRPMVEFQDRDGVRVNRRRRAPQGPRDSDGEMSREGADVATKRLWGKKAAA